VYNPFTCAKVRYNKKANIARCRLCVIQATDIGPTCCTDIRCGSRGVPLTSDKSYNDNNLRRQPYRCVAVLLLACYKLNEVIV